MMKQISEKTLIKFSEEVDFNKDLLTLEEPIKKGMGYVINIKYDAKNIRLRFPTNLTNGIFCNTNPNFKSYSIRYPLSNIDYGSDMEYFNDWLKSFEEEVINKFKNISIFQNSEFGSLFRIEKSENIIYINFKPNPETQLFDQTCIDGITNKKIDIMNIMCKNKKDQKKYGEYTILVDVPSIFVKHDTNKSNFQLNPVSVKYNKLLQPVQPVETVEELLAQFE